MSLLTYWKHKSIKLQHAPATVALGPVSYSALPLELHRNDVYAEGYTYPKAQSDRMKWYNNTFWGNRLPDSGNGIGIPGYGGVTQKTFWTQSSPEQTFFTKWNLTGGPYVYGSSMQQVSNLQSNQLQINSAGYTGGTF
jgi:hypothetical protein